MSTLIRGLMWIVLIAFVLGVLAGFALGYYLGVRAGGPDATSAAVVVLGTVQGGGPGV